MHVYACLRDVHMCAGAVTGHNKESSPLGLLLQMVVSCWMWVVETELWSLQEQQVSRTTDPSLQRKERIQRNRLCLSHTWW